MTGKNQTLARRRWIRSHAKKHVLTLPSAPDTTSHEGDVQMKHPVRNFFIALTVSALVLFGCGGFILTVLNALPGPNTTFVVEPDINSDPMFGNGDPNAWNKPMEDGQMTTEGYVTYTQSGKPNEQTVTGYIAEGQTLVYTGYRVVLTTGDIADNGVVGVIPGPFSLDRYPLTYIDGAATLVASGEATQAKLDSMWVDFCRGDRTADMSAWTYSHWALSHVFLPDEYYFLGMNDCMNASNDTWPNNPPSLAGYETSSDDNSSSTTVSGERLDTNTNGGPISFAAGTPVIGYEIQLSNGTTYSGCYLADPTLAGTVTDGVVFPWENEIAKVPACK